ncbi:MAG: hypothetical protein ACTHX2_06495, partial [Microbacterium sp.]
GAARGIGRQIAAALAARGAGVGNGGRTGGAAGPPARGGPRAGAQAVGHWPPTSRARVARRGPRERAPGRRVTRHSPVSSGSLSRGPWEYGS